MDRPCAIYIARGLTSGLLKIGRTGNVAERLKAIASAVEPVELIATFWAKQSTETALLRHFAAALEPSRGREWFRDDGSIVAFVETLPADRRGSMVFRPSLVARSPRRSRDVVLAERAEKRARFLENYERRHGHSFSERRGGCRQCASANARVGDQMARIDVLRARQRVPTERNSLLFPHHFPLAAQVSP